MNISSIPSNVDNRKTIIIENKATRTKTELSVEQLIAKCEFLKKEIAELKTESAGNKQSDTYCLYLEKKLNFRKILHLLIKNGVIKKQSFEENLATGVIEKTKQERLEKLRILALSSSKIKVKVFQFGKVCERDPSPIAKITWLESRLIEWDIYNEMQKYSPEEISQTVNNFSNGQKRKPGEESEISKEISPIKRRKVTKSEAGSEPERISIVSCTETDSTSTSGTDSESSEDVALMKAQKQIKNLQEQIARQNEIIYQKQFTIENLTRSLNNEIAYKAQSSVGKK